MRGKRAWQTIHEFPRAFKHQHENQKTRVFFPAPGNSVRMNGGSSIRQTFQRGLVGFLLTALILCAASCNTSPPIESNPSDLVDVQRVIPGIVLDIRYATTNNFTGQQLYPVARCCLRTEAADKLKAVQEELHGMGYALKVFDGYRPLSVQKKMWVVYPHPGFVADPAKGSRHNRGAAVDLTLIKLDGTEVPMPTPFDDFTDKAHRDYIDLPPDVIKNRELLEQVMTEHGFKGLKTEWWHFDMKGWQKYPLMDVDYSQIK
jgi:D-alanyl-D-alanine dipeptidase